MKLVLAAVLGVSVLLKCNFYNGADFARSVAEARPYDAGGRPSAGVVPHHLAAAEMIAGFFEMASGYEYDTVFVIAPDHAGDIADAVVSFAGWDFNGAVECDENLAKQIAGLNVGTGSRIAISDERMREDHSVSSLIPYISHYLPEAMVVPVLISRTMPLGSTFRLADGINKIIGETDKSVLLVCSVDFSHFLNPSQARANDLVTERAMLERDYAAIYGFGNEYADCPAALIVFLKHLEANGLEMKVLDRACAADFIGRGVRETTTYFILTGV